MQLKAFQRMANNRPQAKQAAQLQAMADNGLARQQNLIQNKASSGPHRRENNTGLPDNLKSGIENLSGYSLDDIKVYYNSSKPSQLRAHAYAQGHNIYVAPGQEESLPHEAWHVVQQKQGRVRPTMRINGTVNINDDAGLEREADVMGAKASNSIAKTTRRMMPRPISNMPVQRKVWQDKKSQLWRSDEVAGEFKEKEDAEAAEWEERTFKAFSVSGYNKDKPGPSMIARIKARFLSAKKYAGNQNAGKLKTRAATGTAMAASATNQGLGALGKISSTTPVGTLTAGVDTVRNFRKAFRARGRNKAVIREEEQHDVHGVFSDSHDAAKSRTLNYMKSQNKKKTQRNATSSALSAAVTASGVATLASLGTAAPALAVTGGLKIIDSARGPLHALFKKDRGSARRYYATSIYESVRRDDRNFISILSSKEWGIIGRKHELSDFHKPSKKEEIIVSIMQKLKSR